MHCGGMYEIGVIGFECRVTEMKELSSGGHVVTSDLASHVILVSVPSTHASEPYVAAVSIDCTNTLSIKPVQRRWVMSPTLDGVGASYTATYGSTRSLALSLFPLNQLLRFVRDRRKHYL